MLAQLHSIIFREETTLPEFAPGSRNCHRFAPTVRLMEGLSFPIKHTIEECSHESR